MLVLMSDTLEDSAGGDRTLLDDVCRSTNRTVFPYHSYSRVAFHLVLMI